jgi:hypothetical protein
MGKDRIEERVYKSGWHLALMAVGIFEYKTHRSKVAKILATGMILFHADACLADAFDVKPLSRVLLEKATGIKDNG